jgi:hypothetical protein
MRQSGIFAEGGGMRAVLLAMVLLLPWPFATPATGAPLRVPVLVSPGNARQEGRVGSQCPTFSWASAHGASGYVLVLYGAPGITDAAPGISSKPLLEVDLPDGALSWTPSLGECLPGAGRYSWAVGARGEDGEIHWSTPGIFRVIAPETPRGPKPRQPATTAALDGVSAPIVRSATPVSAAAGLPDWPLPRSLRADAFSPPTCSNSFPDVTGHPLCAWIEQFSADQIVTECAGGKYCPDNPVTRAQFALFAQRIMRGTDTWRREAGDGATPNLPPGLPTITPLDLTGLVGLHTSITIGADGLGLIAYHDLTNGGLKVAHCSNVNCTTATITPLDTTTGSTSGNTSISITVGADGLGLISYYDVTNANLKVAHCSNVDCTGTTVPPVSLDTADNVGQWSSITIGADGLGLISYFDATNGNLKVAHCSNLDCSAATITTIDSTNVVGVGPSVTIGADGLALISYADATDFNLKVAHCADVECTSTTVPPTTLDSTGFVGVYSSITIGADGLGLISYHDSFPASDLKVAHCLNVECTGTTVPPTSIDTTGSVGENTSITIGADGLGLISYRDASPNFNLKVAHCSNVECTAATTTPVDTTNAVGQFTSITIGADGLALVSYYDETSDNLKVAHCSNVLCAPFFRRR